MFKIKEIEEYTKPDVIDDTALSSTEDAFAKWFDVEAKIFNAMLITMAIVTILTGGAGAPLLAASAAGVMAVNNMVQMSSKGATTEEKLSALQKELKQYTDRMVTDTVAKNNVRMASETFSNQRGYFLCQYMQSFLTLNWEEPDAVCELTEGNTFLLSQLCKSNQDALKSFLIPSKVCTGDSSLCPSVTEQKSAQFGWETMQMGMTDVFNLHQEAIKLWVYMVSNFPNEGSYCSKRRDAIVVGGSSTTGTETSNYCGSSWSDANSKCAASWPRGVNSECPTGEACFADTSCTGGSSTIPNTYCGTSVNDANSKCATACPTGTNDECPAGESCHPTSCKTGQPDFSTEQTCEMIYQNVFFNEPVLATYGSAVRGIGAMLKYLRIDRSSVVHTWKRDDKGTNEGWYTLEDFYDRKNRKDAKLELAYGHWLDGLSGKDFPSIDATAYKSAYKKEIDWDMDYWSYKSQLVLEEIARQKDVMIGLCTSVMNNPKWWLQNQTNAFANDPNRCVAWVRIMVAVPIL